MSLRLSFLFIFWVVITPASAFGAPKTAFVLNPDSFRPYLDEFNRNDVLERASARETAGKRIDEEVVRTLRLSRAIDCGPKRSVRNISD